MMLKLQTLGFHWSFSCLECTCSGIGVLMNLDIESFGNIYDSVHLFLG